MIELSAMLHEIINRWKDGPFSIDYLPTATQERKWMLILFKYSGLPQHFYGETAEEVAGKALAWLSEMENKTV